MTKKKNFLVLFTKIAIIAAVVLFVGVLKTTATEAKSLREGKTYSYDLNGDGKKEKIKYTTSVNENKVITRATLYINGKKKTSVKCKDSFSAWLYMTDIRKKDKYKELYLSFTWSSDCFTRGYGYRYKSGSLKKIFTHVDRKSVRNSILNTQANNGTVSFSEEYSGSEYLGQGFVVKKYNIKNKKLVPVRQQVYNTTGLWKKSPYHASTLIKVQKSVTDDTELFEISSGTTFYVYKIRLASKSSDVRSTDITHIYIKTSSGKKGWIEVPYYHFYTGNYSYEYLWG